jgi:hypothetical protein
MIHHTKCLIRSLDVLGDDPMMLGLLRNADQQKETYAWRGPEMVCWGFYGLQISKGNVCKAYTCVYI